MAEVQLRGIGKTFGGTTVLKDVSINIDDGEFVVLVGPSGCGKSTLLRILAGLEDVDTGDVLIDGKRVNDFAPIKRGIAMVFQSYALYPHMSVRQNLGFGLRLAGKSRAQVDDAVERAAQLLSIDHLLERRPKMLSGGQRQRVAIGRAIVREPTVFLFDEPLSNLDAELRVRMRYEFAKLHRRLQTTTVYVTHDQVEAMTLADRIAIMDGGRVVQFGAPQDLYESPATMFVAGFLGSPRMNFLPAEVVSVGAAGARVRLRTDHEADAAVNAESLAPGESVILGWRPEHVRISDAGVPATVALVETLGSVRFAYLASAASDDPVVAQLPLDALPKEGDQIKFTANSADSHLFTGGGSAMPRFGTGAGSLAA